MDHREQARQRYVAEFSRFKQAAERMELLLRDLCRDAGSSSALVEVRAKEIGSFVKKLRKYDKDSWTQTTDKVGARIAVETLAEVRRLRGLFEQDQPPAEYLYTIDKSGEASARALFYPGVHIQVVVPEIETSDGERIECEIQLRTQAQNVWAALEHKLIYKGAVTASRETERRVERLSVLIEMFDEEVERAMAELASDPRFELAVLLRRAEAMYLTFVSEPGEDELSFEVLDILNTSIPPEEHNDYTDQLRTFVELNREKLSEEYRTYGIYSAFAEEFGYWLFSQPESLVVFERIENRPMALARAIHGTEIEEVVRRLSSAWGKPIPQP
jgi:ppGpp synthetase/RelA/SpoT-type nucleotidyltranferase